MKCKHLSYSGISRSAKPGCCRVVQIESDVNPKGPTDKWNSIINAGNRVHYRPIDGPHYSVNHPIRNRHRQQQNCQCFPKKSYARTTTPVAIPNFPRVLEHRGRQGVDFFRQSPNRSQGRPSIQVAMLFRNHNYFLVVQVQDYLNQPPSVVFAVEGIQPSPLG